MTFIEPVRDMVEAMRCLPDPASRHDRYKAIAAFTWWLESLPHVRAEAAVMEQRLARSRAIARINSGGRLRR
jgi:hypothetical protein